MPVYGGGEEGKLVFRNLCRLKGVGEQAGRNTCGLDRQIQSKRKLLCNPHQTSMSSPHVCLQPNPNMAMGHSEH